jgi:serine/tyrosine/threonine adenylyltransferase
MNPFLSLKYEPAIESLGTDYYDDVAAADFPLHTLRWRNDDILTQLGLEPSTVTDQDFVEAFGQFARHSHPLMALRYHGYQFGQYNPGLGDGRGFLYGQVRGTDGELYDFGTKGSGRTPYSRGGDGMLTLKGGMREVIAAEALHRVGVKTSRCLSVIETGLDLWRGDEPSPTRSAVMVRFSRSHIRFGTFERLHYLQRPDLIQKLLDHVIQYYYPHLINQADRYLQFYRDLVQRVAELVAQWMVAGFCHAVLNTDNMSITGESFDYGPFAFIPTYQPNFTAAYFDHSGRYSYANQPGICQLNLELLQKPLAAVLDQGEMTAALTEFKNHYQHNYQYLLGRKLGLTNPDAELLNTTIELLYQSQVGYHEFFVMLSKQWHSSWHQDFNLILTTDWLPVNISEALRNQWQQQYHQAVTGLAPEKLAAVGELLARWNPVTIPLRPVIESVWDAIDQEDNWQPFYDLVAKLQTSQ